MDQLVDQLSQMTSQVEVAETVIKHGFQYMDLRLPEAIEKLLQATEGIKYRLDVDWATLVLQFVAQKETRADPDTARSIFRLLEARVKKMMPSYVEPWKNARFNGRYDYVKNQESILREKHHLTMVDGLAGELAPQVAEMDPNGAMMHLLQECVDMKVDVQQKNAALYTMRSFLGVKHSDWMASKDAERWALSAGKNDDQLYLWMCDQYGKENVLEKLTKLVGKWNKQGKLDKKSDFSHVVVRTLIKTLMDKQLYTHAVMVSQKNAHLLHSNPVPFMLSQHKMYNMAGPICVDESRSLEYLCSVVEKSATVKSGRLFASAITAAENHAASHPEMVAYLCGVALARARQQYQVALLLALVDRHNLEIPPNSILDAASYWSRQNIDTCLTLFKAFCKTAPRLENAHYSKATKWKLVSSEPLSNLVSKLTSKHKAWESPKRLGVIFDDINSLPEHALRAHFPEILKLYRKVAHSISQDYVGYTLDGTDYKIMTETEMLTRLSNHLRRHIGAEDKQRVYLRKKGVRGQPNKALEQHEQATRLLAQMRLKLARKLTALTKEIARRQMTVELSLAQDICRVLNDGSTFTFSLNAWRTYLSSCGIVPEDAYVGDGRQTFLFESPIAVEVDCTFLLEGNEKHYETRHVPFFEKPLGSMNTLKTLDTITLMMNELARIGAEGITTDTAVHAKQAKILNDLFTRATEMLESVRSPLFRYKFNQKLKEAYIRAAAHYNQPGAVLVFTTLNFSSSDGATWAAVLSSCIDEDVKMVYGKACELKLGDQTELHDVFIQRSIAKHDWDSVGSGIENLYAYGRFPNETTMKMILQNSGDIDIFDLLVEVSKENIPIYNKDTSLEILKVLTAHTDNPTTAVDYYKNLSGSLGFSGLVCLTEPLSRVDPEAASQMVPKLLALVNSEVPLEYLTELMKYAPDRVFEVACETRAKSTLQNLTVESVEQFVIASLSSGVSPYLVYKFLMNLKTVASSCISVSSLKTVLLQMDPEDAKNEYREFVESISHGNISLDKLWVAKHLYHESYGCDLTPYFDPKRLDDISKKGEYLIPNIFDGLYANSEIPCHSVFYNYTTFDNKLTVEGTGVQLGTQFDGKLKEEYSKRYTEAFSCK
ncbi:hypothetical protein CKK34_3494 [Yarrowia sp. E02]|nr:hypothetical protein CKK34_3494 [Yarrowia sp. E02]